ncbi:MAG: GlsB/YeaQ/YmgE family stress response membrane protein [Oscillospiraceae bacterium]|nr:GlsB/YeaQ/YmgE family stress response membrane protein [Oscillospiraceae bacterium]
MLIQLLVELAIGGLCGFAANRIMKGKTDNIVLNILLGLVGGVVGGLVGNLLGVGGGWITGIILCIVGSCIVVWLWRKFVK